MQLDCNYSKKFEIQEKNSDIIKFSLQVFENDSYAQLKN